jgi:hypothetical protein
MEPRLGFARCVLKAKLVFGRFKNSAIARSDRAATLYLNRRPMPSEPITNNQQPTTDPDKPPGYQPSLGRKLFMFGLCVAGLIFVWTYYYFATHPH